MMTDFRLKKTSCRKLIEAVIEEPGLTEIRVVFDGPDAVIEHLSQTGHVVFLSVIDSKKQYQQSPDEEKKKKRMNLRKVKCRS